MSNVIRISRCCPFSKENISSGVNSEDLYQRKEWYRFMLCPNKIKEKKLSFEKESRPRPHLALMMRKKFIELIIKSCMLIKNLHNFKFDHLNTAINNQGENK